MIFSIYSDGSCSGNKRGFMCPGGYAFLIINEDDEILAQGGGSGLDVTNNIMELKAAICGIKELKKILGDDSKNHDCIVITDSKYVSGNYSDYIQEWKSNGWKKYNKGAIANKALWIELDKMAPEFKSLKFKWVKGHSTNQFNARVDSCAKWYMSKVQTLT